MASLDPELPFPKKICLNYPLKVTSHAACSVPGCSNSGYKHPELTFHSFPVEKQRRLQWIAAIKRDPGRTFEVGLISIS